jgi:hypothetical protein
MLRKRYGKTSVPQSQMNCWAAKPKLITIVRDYDSSLRKNPTRLEVRISCRTVCTLSSWFWTSSAHGMFRIFIWSVGFSYAGSASGVRCVDLHEYMQDRFISTFDPLPLDRSLAVQTQTWVFPNISPVRSASLYSYYYTFGDNPTGLAS